MLAAVTPHDEINILACSWAKAAGVGHTVSRLSDSKYMRSPYVDLNAMGIDRPVIHKEECAKEIFDVLYRPGTMEVTSLLNGKIAAIGLKLPETTPLAESPLKAFKANEWLNKVRLIGLVKDGKLTIPGGDSVPAPGDDVYATLSVSDVDPFLDWVRGEKRKGFKKVVIAGGGELGLTLASLLDAGPMESVLIDNDLKRAEYASANLSRCLVLNADAAQASTLKEAGVDKGTAFASITGDEEMNIVCCIQSKQLGADFTIARIDKAEYVPIISRLNLVDRVVSPNISLIKTILEYVRGEVVENIRLFHRIAGEVQEVVIKPRSKHRNKSISSLKLPRGSIVAAVQRDDNAIVPTGEYKLQEADRLAIYCLPESAGKIKSAF